jgi:hypothetical protein
MSLLSSAEFRSQQSTATAAFLIGTIKLCIKVWRQSRHALPINLADMNAITNEERSSSAAFLIGDNNRDGLAEPYRSSLNDSANKERSTTPHLDTALGEWRGEDPMGPLQATFSSKEQPSGQAAPCYRA